MDQRLEWRKTPMNQFEKLIEANPYDLGTWNIIVREVRRYPIDEARPVLEMLVETFSTNGNFWKMYIQKEMVAQNAVQVEKLFQRCLPEVLNIELWKLYLKYVRESKSTHESYKQKMAEAYEYALDKVGMDVQSFSIWNDYIQFLKSVDTAGYIAEKQKTEALRRVYRRGVVSPMINIERLWRDYVTFERGVHLATAEKMIRGLRREYMNARRVTKEFEEITRYLERNRQITPAKETPDERKQIDLWKKYISWEKGNPLGTKETTLVIRRVVFAFKQSLLCLAHHPEIWYDAANFLETSSELLTKEGDFTAGRIFSNEASRFYEKATSKWVRKNMLLVFAYADFQEKRLNLKKVHQIYKRFVDIPDIDPTLAYVQYMRFSRRAEGKKSARSVFRRSREDPRSNFHVYVAAALLEYHCTQDKNISFRIFQLGLKKFPNNIEFIHSFINYLSHLNEESNTRDLFERILSSDRIEKKKLVSIWNKYLDFETINGKMEDITTVDDGRRAFLEEINGCECKQYAKYIDRYKFLNLYPCSGAELKSMDYKVSTTAQKLKISRKRSLMELEDHSQSMPRPDFSKMIPFKPWSEAVHSCHPVGKGFQIPPAVAQFCRNLPPPEKYWGPYVDIDDMINLFKNIHLPESLLIPKLDTNYKIFRYCKSVL